ncbi:MAG: hypothetical protein HQL45_16165 [Alphaproteobacteria bacterium]|nr:hypothetical protein [Alphaproteobacteria bacterium]
MPLEVLERAQERPVALPVLPERLAVRREALQASDRPSRQTDTRHGVAPCRVFLCLERAKQRCGSSTFDVELQKSLKFAKQAVMPGLVPGIHALWT